jgi:hypothetical protein
MNNRLQLYNSSNLLIRLFSDRIFSQLWISNNGYISLSPHKIINSIQNIVTTTYTPNNIQNDYEPKRLPTKTKPNETRTTYPEEETIKTLPTTTWIQHSTKKTVILLLHDRSTRTPAKTTKKDHFKR